MQTQDESLEEAARQRAEDIKFLMSHKQGRRFMWRLLEVSGVFQNPFNNSGSITAFNCGRMNVGQVFLAEIVELTPAQHALMLKEGQTNDD